MNTSGKLRTRLIAVVLAAALAFGGVALWTHIREAHGHDHAHGDGSHETPALALNDGNRWETDAPLRTGMEKIRSAAVPVLAAAARRELPASQATQFAATVQESVAYLVKNCKLEPKADATLHVVITDLMSGSGLLAGDPASAEGAALVARALQRYPEYFDHPGWLAPGAADPRG